MVRSLAVGCGSRSHRRGSPVQRCRSAESKLYGLPGTLVGLRLLLQGDRDAEARFTRVGESNVRRISTAPGTGNWSPLASPVRAHPSRYTVRSAQAPE
jgi:hypothetical protein